MTPEVFASGTLADRLAMAAGLMTLALAFLVAACYRLWRYRRRPTARLARLRQAYGVERRADRKATAPSRDTKGLLARAYKPRSRAGRVRYALSQRISAVGGSAAAAGIAALALAAAGGAALVLAQVVGPVAGIGAGIVVGFLSVPVSLRRLESRIRSRFLNDFPEAIDMIVRAVQAGLPVSQALASVADELDGPVGAEFRRISDELRIGFALQTALANAAVRMPLPDFRFFVVTLALQNETGGRLSETLSNLSDIIRTRDDARAKVRGLTADGRASAAVVAALPPSVAGLLLVINPGYIDPLIGSDAGRVLLAVAATSVTLGIVTVRRMARIEA